MAELGKIGSFMIVVLIGVSMVVGFNLFYGGVLDNYDVAYDNVSIQTGSLEAAAELNESVSSIANNLRESSASENNFISLSTGAFSAALQAFNVLDIALNFVSLNAIFLAQTGLDIGWFIGYLGIILAAYIALLLLQTFFGRDF